MNQRIKDLLEGRTTRSVFPFFWLRGEDEKTLREYMHVIHDAGCRAVCLESRPHPDFCGPKWWHDLDIILEEARQLDMKIWILDDSHFPTGYCNGALHAPMEEGDYSLLRQSVTRRVLGEVHTGETLSLPWDEICLPGEPTLTRADAYFMKPFPRFEDEALIGVSAVRLAKGAGAPLAVPFSREDGVSWTAPDGKWRVYGIYLTRNRGPHRDYMNMLSFPSCRTLIDTVYEPHYRHYGDEFGRTILGFFSDEPELGNGHIYQTDKRLHEVEDLPWSNEVQSALREAWGAAWAARLPLLWDEEADPDLAAQARWRYMDIVTRLVQKDFSEQIGSWCRAHGVRYIGHLIEDHGQHTRCGSSLGHYFRGLKGQDMAGIDDIGGQVLPQGEDLNIRSKWQDHRDGTFYHFALGALAASAAAIESEKHGDAMCEIFGNYGWSEGVALEKYLADHFMVRGINHFVPHAFSAAPFPDKDCPPHFYAHGHNPQYRHFGCLVRYMERVCHLIQGGHAFVRAAILYHAEADWAGGKAQSAEAVGRVLAEHQVGYHFIPSDVFADRAAYHTRIDREDHCLRIHHQAYQVLIVPESSYITAPALQGIREMAEAGVPVWFMGSLPGGVLTETGDRALPFKPDARFRVLSMDQLDASPDLSALAQALLTPGSRMIRCLHYVGEDYDLYYAVNEAAEPWTGTVRFLSAPEDAKQIYRYDAWNNRCVPVSMEDGSVLSVTWEPRKGYLYVFDRTDAAPEMAAESEVDGMVPVPLTRWTRSVCPNAACPVFSGEKEVTLPDAYEKEDPDFGGFVRYDTVFTLSEKPAYAELVLTGDQEGVEVFVNGTSAGIQIVPRYCFDLTGLLRKGENTLRIEQATTLERVIRNTASVSLTPIEPRNHVGLSAVPVLMLRNAQR